MRTLFAALLLTLFSSVGFAAQAPDFGKMSAAQIQQYFAGKSFMHYDRGPGGTAVGYFSSNGTIYTFGTGAEKVGKSAWNVISEPRKAYICFFEVSVRVRELQGAKVTTRICSEVKEFVRGAVDLQEGDVLGLSKRSKPGFVLDKKKTSFAKLLGR